MQAKWGYALLCVLWLFNRCSALVSITGSNDECSEPPRDMQPHSHHDLPNYSFLRVCVSVLKLIQPDPLCACSDVLWQYIYILCRQKFTKFMPETKRRRTENVPTFAMHPGGGRGGGIYICPGGYVHVCVSVGCQGVVEIWMVVFHKLFTTCSRVSHKSIIACLECC